MWKLSTFDPAEDTRAHEDEEAAASPAAKRIKICFRGSSMFSARPGEEKRERAGRAPLPLPATSPSLGFEDLPRHLQLYILSMISNYKEVATACIVSKVWYEGAKPGAAAAAALGRVAEGENGEPETRLRLRALNALRELGYLANAHVELIAAQLQHDSSDVKTEALLVLRGLGGEAEPYVENVIGLVGELGVHEAAVQVLEGLERSG
ncbi:hypothetical protein CYMTET_29796, partial [Cymbomonas tetramitiformis]